MAHQRLSDYLVLKEMPPGRHGFALGEVRKIVERMGLSNITPLVDVGIEKATWSQELDLKWEGTKKKTNAARGDARGIKRKIVRQLSGIYKIVDGKSEGDDDDPVCRHALEVITDVFPTGVEGIAAQPFEVMHGTLKTIIRTQFEGEKADRVEALGIGREVARLKRLTEALGAELSGTGGKGLTFDKVELARDDVHEATARVEIAVLHQFSGEDADSVRDREAVLAPINFQQAQVAEARAQHRQPVDVDPKTGEELDLDGVDDEETNENAT